MALYPLKFQPLFQYRIWGGEKLKTVLNKKYTQECIGESWEISAVPNNKSIVTNGNLKGETINALIKTYQSDFLGKKVFEKFGEEFPLLIKFIDAETPLSIQVHPDDDLAKERHNSFGKNEMWYAMDAQKDAELIVGFQKSLEQSNYKAVLEKDEITNYLNKIKVNPKDAFYNPAGCVHAIGAGLLILEIQQTSDVTYRIYDYNRIEAATGRPRVLHTDLAEDAIDYSVKSDYKAKYNESQTQNKLIHSPFFKTDVIVLNDNQPVSCGFKDSFQILICVEGDVDVLHDSEHYKINRGEVLFIPAKLSEAVLLRGHLSKLIQVYL